MQFGVLLAIALGGAFGSIARHYVSTGIYNATGAAFPYGILGVNVIGGLIMGVWYLSISIGNFTGGRISSLYGSMPLPRLFGVVGGFGIGAAIVMFLLAPPIKRLMGGVN